MLLHNRFASTLMTVATLGLLAASPAVADEGWRPYLQEDRGAREFPENPKQLKDEKWLNIAYSEFAGFRPRVGVVMSEERRQGAQEYDNQWLRFFLGLNDRPGGLDGISNIETQVRQALGGTHRFVMVERTTALDDVIEEQDFGASGRVDRKTAARSGMIRGADYTVKIELVDINPEKESKSIQAVGGAAGVASQGIASLGVSGKVAWARLNVRVIRTETSELVSDMTVDGTAKGGGFNLKALAARILPRTFMLGGISYDSKKVASLSDAIQVAANKAAYHIALQLEEQPWEGAVTKVEGTRVVINAGSNIGLQAGLSLSLLSKGEEQIDPETNESLGFDSTEIGAIRIVSVAEKFATCEIVEGGQGAKRGDLVRLQRNKN